MIVAADASFLVSLYGGDWNTPAARAWMAASAEPVLLTGALRFESENALRLACFRSRITAAELAKALADIADDLDQGILVEAALAAEMHWEECRRISAAQTLSTGARAYDITHVAAAVLLGAEVFLSFDERQRQLAVQMGLKVKP